MRSAPSAIRSIQDSRKRLRHVAVLTSSTRNTVLNRKQTQQAEVEASQPLCFIRWRICLMDKSVYRRKN